MFHDQDITKAYICRKNKHTIFYRVIKDRQSNPYPVTFLNIHFQILEILLF